MKPAMIIQFAENVILTEEPETQRQTMIKTKQQQKYGREWKQELR